jgi:hypothetical protein
MAHKRPKTVCEPLEKLLYASLKWSNEIARFMIFQVCRNNHE